MKSIKKKEILKKEKYTSLQKNMNLKTSDKPFQKKRTSFTFHEKRRITKIVTRRTRLIKKNKEFLKKYKKIPENKEKLEKLDELDMTEEKIKEEKENKRFSLNRAGSAQTL